MVSRGRGGEEESHVRATEHGTDDECPLTYPPKLVRVTAGLLECMIVLVTVILEIESTAAPPTTSTCRLALLAVVLVQYPLLRAAVGGTFVPPSILFARKEYSLATLVATLALFFTRATLDSKESPPVIFSMAPKIYGVIAAPFIPSTSACVSAS